MGRGRINSRSVTASQAHLGVGREYPGFHWLTCRYRYRGADSQHLPLTAGETRYGREFTDAYLYRDKSGYWRTASYWGELEQEGSIPGGDHTRRGTIPVEGPYEGTTQEHARRGPYQKGLYQGGPYQEGLYQERDHMRAPHRNMPGEDHTRRGYTRGDHTRRGYTRGGTIQLMRRRGTWVQGQIRSWDHYKRWVLPGARGHTRSRRGPL